MAAAKAANGRSSIFCDEAGWHGWVSLGTDALTGRRRRKHVRGSTRAEVVKKVQKLEVQRESGDLDLHGADVTVEVWLRHWLTGVHRTRRASTYQKSEWACRLYLIPALGEARLGKLTPSLIERALGSLTKTNSGGIDVAVSDKTKREVLNIFVNALNVAVEQRRMTRNPCKGVRLAKPDSEEVKPLSREEIAAVVAVVEERPNGARWLLALALGLRQSEVLGLQWCDVDLDRHTLTVRKQLARLSWSHGCEDPGGCGPASRCKQRRRRDRQSALKTRRSHRTLHLEEPLVTALRTQRARQAKDRLRVANLWVDSGDWVFTSQTGSPIEHRNDLRDWKAVLKAAGVPHTKIHNLRHTNATMLLLGGVSTRVVQELMGWTSPAMAGRYQHVVPELSQQAARAVGAAMFGGPVDGP